MLHEMQIARLSPDDATAVYNMRLLESSSDPKKSSIVPFSLKFDVHKVENIQIGWATVTIHAMHSFSFVLVCRRSMLLEKTDLVKK